MDNNETIESANRSIRVRNITVGILRGERSFNGYVGFDDIDEMSSLMIFLDDDETPLGYSIKKNDKCLAVNNCDGGNVDDFFLRKQLPEALKDKWDLVLLATIDIDEAEDEGIEHYVYFPDEEAENETPFNIESDFSDFSQVGRFLAVHQVMGWFEWNSDVELELPLDKFLSGEITDGLLLLADNIGFISDYETESEQLCLILSEMTSDLQAIDTKNVVSGTSNTGGITAAPVDGRGQDAFDSSAGMVSREKEKYTMKFELKVVYRNGDNGQSDEQIIVIETENEKMEFLGMSCSGRPTHQIFDQLFKAMYDNPTMDGAEKGELYDELWPIMSRWAFDKLGWHDVTVSVIGLSIDGKDTRLEECIELGTVDEGDWAIQLSREGYMYCYA